MATGNAPVKCVSWPLGGEAVVGQYQEQVNSGTQGAVCFGSVLEFRLKYR